MPTTAAIPRGDGSARPLRSASVLLVYAALLWPAVSGGAHAGWPLAATQLLILAALLAWLLGMADAGRLEWRRTALDLPLALFIGLVLLQLAIGNGSLRHWALAPPSAAPQELPRRFLLLGTVSPAQTVRALLLFLSYAAVYVLVVNLVRRRHELDRLVRILLIGGAGLAFFSIVDYLVRESWLFPWRPGVPGPRLTGPFVNPDHWASWMVMLLCLGIGYLAARRGARDPVRRRREPASSRSSRERALRQYLPFVGLTLIALAIVLTLSRGALLALLAAGLVLLTALARVRSRRWVLVIAAGLAGATFVYALWIGIEPLLARLSYSEHVGRLEQWRSSLPMLTSFPVLGVGLGAYKDIYFRFQPALLLPGRVYFPYAHSDLLQLVIETGPPGGALALWATWRLGRDLVGAHVLGRGRCPVTSEVRTRRTDPFSVGTLLGALAAVVALLAHSAVDFSARIPADGVLAAACLGIATVAAHTRFGVSGSHSLAKTRELALGSDLRSRASAGAIAALLGAALVPPIVSQSRAAAVAAGAEVRVRAARQVWASQPAPGDPRASDARSLVAGAADELRRGIAATPSDPYLHERLAWALDLQAALDPAAAEPLRLGAFTHMRRAVALQPDNPLLLRSLSALALSQPAPQLDLALEAGRAAIARDPSLLGSLVDRLAPLALTDTQWTALVPADPIERADLAMQMEARGFLHEARVLYERALEGAPTDNEVIIRWMLARLLLGLRRPAEALAQADAALELSPGNPELLLTRARALEAGRSPDALEAYRAALAGAEGRRRREVFATESPRLRAAVKARLGDHAGLSPARYRRALAERLTEERQWLLAREEWERAREEAALDAAGEFSRGLALAATGEPQRATEAFRQAVKLDPSRAAFRMRLAARLWEDERYMQAIVEWQTIASQEPGNVDVALALGRAYLKTGERARALAEYQRALTLSPGLAEARQAVAKLQGKP